MMDFVEGMHKVGEALAAVICAKVTLEAQAKLAEAEAKK